MRMTSTKESQSNEDAESGANEKDSSNDTQENPSRNRPTRSQAEEDIRREHDHSKGAGKKGSDGKEGDSNNKPTPSDLKSSSTSESMPVRK
jgi:hypothetical protein